MARTEEYFGEIDERYRVGNATEHTYRGALGALLESVEADASATNEPRRIECGAPDFIVSRSGVPVGYVEAKDVGVDLRREESGAQLKRYRDALPNLILTDYLEFRWYVDGEPRGAARLGRENGESLEYDIGGAEDVEGLLRSFFAHESPAVSDPEELARRMAGQAREIRGLIERAFQREGRRGQLHTQLKAFKDVLIPDLDACSPTYACGLSYRSFGRAYLYLLPFPPR